MKQKRHQRQSNTVAKVVLKSVSALAPQVKRTVTRLLPRLARLLPAAEIEHVGATSIPGAITKGDIDVVVRVARSSFTAAIRTLQADFETRQPENWTKAFASFGDDAGYPLPVGIQLVAKGGGADFLSCIRDYLVANPSALAEYNRLKVQQAGKGAEQYWRAKNAFFTRLLAAEDRGRRAEDGRRETQRRRAGERRSR